MVDNPRLVGLLDWLGVLTRQQKCSSSQAILPSMAQQKHVKELQPPPRWGYTEDIMDHGWIMMVHFTLSHPTNRLVVLVTSASESSLNHWRWSYLITELFRWFLRTKTISACCDWLGIENPKPEKGGYGVWHWVSNIEIIRFVRKGHIWRHGWSCWYGWIVKGIKHLSIKSMWQEHQDKNIYHIIYHVLAK